MYYGITRVALSIAIVTSVTHVEAEAIKVVKNPEPHVAADEHVLYDHWVESWGLNDDAPSLYPQGIAAYPTVEAATAGAKARIARTAGNGASAVTHCLIVGEPTVRSKLGPSLPSDRQAETHAIARLPDDARMAVLKALQDDAENLFKKKNQEVKDAYRRAKEAKEIILRTGDDVAPVNELIAAYNEIKDTYAEEQQLPQYFAALPRLLPVSADDVKPQQEKFKKFRASRQELENVKHTLDQERGRIEQERQRIVDAVREIDTAQAALAGLDKKSTKKAGLLEGPFAIYLGLESHVEGTKQGEFDSFLVARAAGECHLSENASRQPNYKITDKSGTRVEYVSPTESQKASQELIDQSKAQKPPAEDHLAEIAKQTETLKSQKQHRQSQLAKYQHDLSSYQQQLAVYQKKLSSQ